MPPLRISRHAWPFSTGAILDARLIGYAGSKDGLSPAESQRLADLADTVHNLPDLIQRWEEVDEPLLRGMLADYDDRWGHVSSFRLADAYDDALARARGSS